MFKIILTFVVLAALYSGTAGANDTFIPSEESIGGVRLGMSEKEALDSISCNPHKQHEKIYGSSGASFEIWTFHDCGIELQMVSQKKKSMKSVRGILVQKPSELKTAQGIGIGSMEKEVEIAYGQFKNIDFSREMEAFVVTSAKGDAGMKIDIKDGKVDRIFLGPIEE